ncbi:hypothetical protein MW887_001522 [Aspergillus wentii]|nr:hypothetical protein MW887_001522 [Aspergillus wentii]
MITICPPVTAADDYTPLLMTPLPLIQKLAPFSSLKAQASVSASGQSLLPAQPGPRCTQVGPPAVVAPSDLSHPLPHRLVVLEIPQAANPRGLAASGAGVWLARPVQPHRGQPVL